MIEILKLDSYILVRSGQNEIVSHSLRQLKISLQERKKRFNFTGSGNLYFERQLEEVCRGFLLADLTESSRRRSLTRSSRLRQQKFSRLSPERRWPTSQGTMITVGEAAAGGGRVGVAGS